MIWRRSRPPSRRRRSPSIAAALERVAARVPAGHRVVAVGVGAFLARGPRRRGCRIPVAAARRPARAARRERWPRRSRCRCSAVSEPCPLVVKVGGGLLRDEGLDGLRRACAEVERAGCGPPRARRARGRSVRRCRARRRRAGGARRRGRARARAARDGSARRAAGADAPGRRAADRSGRAPRAGPARGGAGVRRPPGGARVVGGHERLAGGAGGRGDRSRGGGPAQAGGGRGGAVAVGRPAAGGDDRRRAAGVAGRGRRAGRGPYLPEAVRRTGVTVVGPRARRSPAAPASPRTEPNYQLLRRRVWGDAGVLRVSPSWRRGVGCGGWCGVWPDGRRRCGVAGCGVGFGRTGGGVWGAVVWCGFAAAAVWGAVVWCGVAVAAAAV